MLKVLILYLPVIAVNIYGLTEFKRATTPFYLVVDSLILQAYAFILIIIVMTQREKVLSAESLFNFAELFQFGKDEEHDADPMFDIYQDSFRNT